MVTIAITGHRRRLRAAVHGAALILWAALELALLPHPPAAALGMIVGAAIAWNAARRGAGRETITVTPSALVVRRALGPFRVARRYEIARIRRPRLAAPARGRYRVEFDVDGRTRRFGRNLTAPEAACIVGLLRRGTLSPVP